MLQGARIVVDHFGRTGLVDVSDRIRIPDGEFETALPEIQVATSCGSRFHLCSTDGTQGPFIATPDRRQVGGHRPRPPILHQRSRPFLGEVAVGIGQQGGHPLDLMESVQHLFRALGSADGGKLVAGHVVRTNVLMPRRAGEVGEGPIVIEREPFAGGETGPAVALQNLHDAGKPLGRQLRHHSEVVVIDGQVQNTRVLRRKFLQDLDPPQEADRLIGGHDPDFPPGGKNALDNRKQLLGHTPVHELHVRPPRGFQHPGILQQAFVEVEAGDVPLDLVHHPLPADLGAPAPCCRRKDLLQRTDPADPVLGVQRLPGAFVLTGPLAHLRHPDRDVVGLRVGVDGRLEGGQGQFRQLRVIQRGFGSRDDGQAATDAAPFGAFEQRSELGCEIGGRSRDRHLHPAALGVQDQRSPQLQPGFDEALVARIQGEIGIPELGGVAEQFPSRHVGSDGVVVVVPEPRRFSLDPLQFIVQIGLPAVGVEVDAGELQLGQLIDQAKEVRGRPRLAAGGEILDRGMGPHSQDGLHDHVQLSEVQFLLCRQDVTPDQIPDSPTLGQFVHRPEGGAGAASTDDQRRAPPGGDAPQHDPLIAHFGKRGPRNS